jgi:outer membrane biosynthesis protein TonB
VSEVPASPSSGASGAPATVILDQLSQGSTGVGLSSTPTVPGSPSEPSATLDTDLTGALSGTDTSVVVEAPAASLEVPAVTAETPVAMPVAELPAAPATPTATEAQATPAEDSAPTPAAPTPAETPQPPAKDAPVVAEAPAPTKPAPASTAPVRKSTTAKPTLKKPATELKSVPKLASRGVTVTGTASRPQFPWPPPQASTVVRLPLDRFDDALKRGIQGEIADLLENALDQGGYFDRSYWVAPGGFALATRLERITDQGEPVDANDRWPTSTLKERFDLSKYLRALFYTDPGFFRVIVFVLSTEFERTSDEEPTPKEAFRWLRRGMVMLPRDMAEQSVTERHELTALIYEFEREAGSDAVVLAPGRLTGRTHLARARLQQLLGSE